MDVTPPRHEATTHGTTCVTGATGFIGSRLCSVLERRGVRIVELRRPPVGGRNSDDRGRPTGRAVVLADLATEIPLELPEGIDTIFHLAGKAHALSEVSQDDAEYARINRDGTRHLLEAAQRKRVRAFVFFSSVKAVGPAAQTDGRTVGQSDGTQRPIDETVDWPPDTAYGRSKREAEDLVLHGGYVPHPVVLRPALVYGPGVLGNLEKMIEAVARGRFPPLPEVGNKRSMVHVDDLIAAAVLAAEKVEAAGRTYIVADNAPCSTREIFLWTCRALGRPVPRWTTPRWTLQCAAMMGDVIGKARGRRFVFDSKALEKLTGNAWYSSERLQRELGWKPQRTICECLPDIVAACRAARSEEGAFR